MPAARAPAVVPAYGYSWTGFYFGASLGYGWGSVDAGANGLTFPNLNAKGGESTQTNLILPEPTQFIHKALPACSVVRPTLDQNAGAVATINSFTADQLFKGQSARFFRTVTELARAADAAERQVSDH